MKSPQQAPELSSWQCAIVGLCGSWFDYRSAERFLQDLPAPVAKQLGSKGSQSAPALLSFARQRLSRFPFSRVDPSWLEAQFPRDPLIQEWLARFVPESHHQALRLGETSWSLSAEAPAWFPLWMEKVLADRLRYPVTVPGEVDSREPVSQLPLLSGADAQALLRVFGLRLVAAALYRLERHEIIDSLYGLPQAMAERVVALVRERQFPSTQDWSGTLSYLRERATAEDVPLRMAVIDVGLHCRHYGRAPLARRVALRLPRSLGEQLLAVCTGQAEVELESVPEQAWHASMRRDMKDMVAQGYLQPPALNDEVRA